MNVNDVIKYPILTEKTYQQMEMQVYSFAVDRRASKIEIKHAVEFIFDVEVEKVNTFNVPKKAKRIGRYHGFTNAYKKAIVTLKPGSTIHIFPEEGIAKDDELKKQKQAEAKKVAKAKEIELEDKVAKKLAAAKAKKTTDEKETKSEVKKASVKKVTTKKSTEATKKSSAPKKAKSTKAEEK